MSPLVTTVPMARNTSTFNNYPYLVKLTILVALFFIAFLFTGYVNAADMFAGGKQDVIDATSSDSMLYLVITALSLIVAMIAGVTTKNWFAAVGGFAASMIFLKVGMGMVGLG